eukprot:1401792-Prymnesium_polylepis.3
MLRRFSFTSSSSSSSRPRRSSISYDGEDATDLLKACLIGDAVQVQDLLTNGAERDERDSVK